MAVLPQAYPAVSLESEQLTVLQNLLLEEVAGGAEYAASFLGVEFRGGMLQVDCNDQASADWLREFTPKLSGWTGPVLCAKRAEDLPVMHRMTVFLPRSDDKPYQFALNLIKNQNRGLSIAAWRVVSSQLEDKGDLRGWRLYLYIDDESYRYIRAASFRLFYRFSMVVMRPHKPVTTGSKEDGKTATQPSGSASTRTGTMASKEMERMQVDAVAKQPGVSRVEQTTKVATADVLDAQETELPSTQELLEGLEDHDQVDSSANDGGDVDMPPLEPLP
ncbi:uncharacterized protein LOC128200889 [Galleria mellonella]|uniref:Uncharacterized protein LOC128200889 n=1 Tax=Galleria mellonella TaxID=7137 RepID=A0ABM3MJY9_GALME|nr:uncharacterized protein LOC128200889 [Galleria mellonella]